MRAHAASHPRRTGIVLALAGSVALALVLGWGADVSAGTVHLLNGQVIEGRIVDVTTEHVTVQVRAGSSFGYSRILLTEVMDIQLDSGESVYAQRVHTALKQVRTEVAKEAKAKKEIRDLMKGARTGEEADDEEEQEETEEQSTESTTAQNPNLMGISFGEVYEHRLHGFRVRYPVRWGKPKSPGAKYVVFRDGRPEARGLWSFNITIFERWELKGKFDELVKHTTAELESHKDYYRVLSSGPAKITTTRSQRTSGIFEKKGTIIRHEQLIIETRREELLLFHFFAPGAGEGPVPEFEAVIQSIELT
ncbi:hypothetical protein ACFL59_02065 [Planctomycetota bacterium]